MIYDGSLRDTTNFSSSKYIEINSCNIQRSRGKAHTVIRGKGRVDYHVLYVAEGECRCMYEGEEYVIKKGGFIIYPPQVKQRYSFMEGMSVTTMWLHFTGVGVEELLCELGLCGGVFSSMAPAEVEHYFRKMINAHSLNMPKYRVSARGYLMNLLSALSVDGAGYNSATYSGAVAVMVEYINLNWQKSLSVAELAELVNLSDSRAAHLFRKTVGVSIHRYVGGIKIANSKELLSNTDMSVAEISSMVGYDDPLYFSRVFKAATGMSPREYRSIENEPSH